MTTIRLELDRSTPEAAVRVLQRLPGVTVRVRRREPRLVVDGRAWPLLLVPGGLRPYGQSSAPILKSLASGGKVGLVVADRLAKHVRRELETAGFAYADGTGAIHIDLPGLLLHVEPERSTAGGGTRRPAGMGVVGVRVAQCLLGDPTRKWSVADLARQAACAAGEAHRIIVRLEGEGFLEASGRAKTLRRYVRDPGALLDWLATVPSARRVRERLDVSLYARDPMALVTKLSARALEADVPYAVTGATGAGALGAPVSTAVPITLVRIAPDVPSLAEAAQLLGVEPVDAGANMVLIRDVGELGLHGRVSSGSVYVAPPVRIWLDMLGEPRGEDAAALFREAVIGW
ncbi:MAG: hypothetical protein JWL57_1084 [Actinobacteria bacterium]|nr:hypothetical protein [Actinomycetota bacterium]